MFILLITAIIIGVISYYVWLWTYWKRRGVPGPLGQLFSGVMVDMLDDHNPPLLKIRDWTKKYGRYYGITEGTQQTLVISDPALINEVFIKQYDNFFGRKLNPVQGDPETDVRADMFFAQGFRWKRLRAISAPTFTSNNLRKMRDTVEECALECVRLIERDGGNEKDIDILLYFQEYTFDVIGRIAMGQHESRQFQNPLVDDVKAIFGPNPIGLFVAAGVFPLLAKLFIFLIWNFPIFGAGPAINLFKVIREAVTARIKQREDDKEKGMEQGEPADFIDLFLDAKADVKLIQEANDDFSKTNSYTNRQLTVDEIVAQCFLFLVAGFDTTALSLSYSSYLLATHPNIMKKVQEEIDRECPDPSLTYDQLSKLKYMDCVIKETLRMYPLGAFASARKCLRPTKLGNIEIEVGTNVQADPWTLHYDKKIWGEDAHEFRPERWESGGCEEQISKGGYLPFGLGPRQCIGMRLAYMEEKLLLCQILRKYTFKTTPKTNIPLKLMGRATTHPSDVFLKLSPRY